MKTQTWIKLIGILCIVFGALGLISNISFFLLEFIDMENDISSKFPAIILKWKVRLAYMGIFINKIYLISGIFFLTKKSFSLKMMYAVLTISVLYQFVPLLFLNQYDSNPKLNFGFNISNLLGPVIDLALLMGVYGVRKNYFNPPDKSTKKELTPQFFKILTFVGLLSLSISASIYWLWINAFNLGTTQAERVGIYHSYFPEFLHGKWTITLISVAFCILAIIISSINLKLSGVLWKVLNIVILSITILLLLLNLFTML